MIFKFSSSTQPTFVPYYYYYCIFLIYFVQSSSSPPKNKVDTKKLIVAAEGGQECDKFVRIESKDPYGYLANVSFWAPTTANTSRWTLNMTTNVPYLFISSWHVVIFMEDGPNGLARFHNTDSRRVNGGDAISFRFRVMFAPGKPVPKCSKLVWEDHVICPIMDEPIRGSKKDDAKIRPNGQEYDQSGTVPLWLFFLLLALLTLSVTCHLLILCRQRIQDCLGKLKWPTNLETDTVELCEAQKEEQTDEEVHHVEI